MKEVVKNFFKGNKRSVKAKLNIIYTFFIKGGSILVSLALVPLIIDYIGTESYGVWLTLSSIITWFGFFNIGLGSGLRNKFTEAIATGETILARTYVSTTYAILSAIFGVVLIFFIIINPILNWENILNTESIKQNELSIVVSIVFIFFILNLLFKTIGSILLADQRPAVESLFLLIGKGITVLLIYFLTIRTEGSLINLALVFSIVPVVVLIIANFILFKNEYKIYSPSFKYVDLSKVKDLTGLSFRFFIIQVAVIILFTTDNIIISQLFSPNEVTTYNISKKYFGVATMVFSIILSPFWSASTEAFVKKDFKWIKKSIRTLIWVWLLMLIAMIPMLIFSDFFYILWIKDRVVIPFTLSLGWALFVVINLFGAMISQFINGSGKIKISLFTAIINIIINIPLSIFLARDLKLGLFGVILATTICITISIIIRSIQLEKIIHKKDTGIWGQ